MQPNVEEFMPLVYIKKDNQSKSLSRTGRSFYFDKYSRKDYYDEEQKSNKKSTGAIEGSPSPDPNQEVIVVNQRAVQRRGTMAFK